VGEKRAARACDVHDAERPAGEDEAVGVAGCVAVKTGDLSRVVDAEGARACRERKVDGREHASLEQKGDLVMAHSTYFVIDIVALTLAAAVAAAFLVLGYHIAQELADLSPALSGAH
jgi:hypothetical protein